MERDEEFWWRVAVRVRRKIRRSKIFLFNGFIFKRRVVSGMSVLKLKKIRIFGRRFMEKWLLLQW